LGLAVFTLEPERDARARSSAMRMAIEYPRCSERSRNIRRFSQYRGMREWFRWQSGENARVVIASDVVFMKALVNTILLRLSWPRCRRPARLAWRF
jgi:multiple sugar transport system permease protein